MPACSSGSIIPIASTRASGLATTSSRSVQKCRAMRSAVSCRKRSAAYVIRPAISPPLPPGVTSSSTSNAAAASATSTTLIEKCAQGSSEPSPPGANVASDAAAALGIIALSGTASKRCWYANTAWKTGLYASLRATPSSSTIVWNGSCE
eukprot:358490-Chlamydomonas_euryale.AAC.7